MERQLAKNARLRAVEKHRLGRVSRPGDPLPRGSWSKLGIFWSNFFGRCLLVETAEAGDVSVPHRRRFLTAGIRPLKHIGK